MYITVIYKEMEKCTYFIKEDKRKLTEFQRGFNAVLQSIEQMIHYATVSCAQRFYAMYQEEKRGEKKTHLKCIDGIDGGQEYDHQKCKNDVTTCLYCNFF